MAVLAGLLGADAMGAGVVATGAAAVPPPVGVVAEPPPVGVVAEPPDGVVGVAAVPPLVPPPLPDCARAGPASSAVANNATARFLSIKLLLSLLALLRRQF